MDKPTPRERVLHMLEAIRLIRTFVSEMDEQQFVQDAKVQSAVQFQFLVIGEAVRNLDDDILNRYAYPWHIPRSFRNFIIHLHHGIKTERIFYATQDLETLESRLTEILHNEF